MTVKRYYIKKDAVEYQLHSFTYSKEGSSVIDTTNISLSRSEDSNFDIGDDVSIGYHDGTDTFVAEFNGDITSKQVNQELLLTMESYDGRLNRSAFISTVYEDKTLEFIVEDIITTYTDLTYASTGTTGITLSRFVINEETAREVVNRILKNLDWQTRVDNSKNFYFETSGAITASVILTVGTNAFMDASWAKNPNRLVNSCTVIGDNARFDTTESFTASASQTLFTMVYKIIGNVRVTVNGTEKIGGADGATGTFDYSFNKDKKEITFESALSGGETVVVTYAYEVPIKITARNEESITSFTLFPTKITDDTLKTTSDARKLAKKVVSVYGTPFTSGNLTVSWTENIDVGETVQVIDTFNNIDQEFVVVKLSRSYPEGTKKIFVGIDEFNFSDWNKSVGDRVKRLEAMQDNADVVQKYLSFIEKVNVVSKPGRIRTRTRDTSTDSIWGVATWGTDDWDGTYDNDFVVKSVTNYNKIMIERFNFDTYKDTVNTTATWNTAGETTTYTSGQLSQSLSVALNNGTITTATLTSTEVSGSFTYEITANGTNWETVTSGTAHNFTNTGADLRWRATENNTSTGEINNIQIKYG